MSKTYTFSKKDTEYLQPLESVLTAMNVAIQVYVVNVVFKRLGIPANAKARYDLNKGELYLLDEEKPAETKPIEKPEVDVEPAKPEEQEPAN